MKNFIAIVLSTSASLFTLTAYSQTQTKVPVTQTRSQTIHCNAEDSCTITEKMDESGAWSFHEGIVYSKGDPTKTMYVKADPHRPRDPDSLEMEVQLKIQSIFNNPVHSDVQNVADGYVQQIRKLIDKTYKDYSFHPSILIKRAQDLSENRVELTIEVAGQKLPLVKIGDVESEKLFVAELEAARKNWIAASARPESLSSLLGPGLISRIRQRHLNDAADNRE